VFNVGEPCNEFHLVVTGQIKLFVLSPAGQEKVVELIGPGQRFGEALIFTDTSYILSVQSLTTTLILILTVGKHAVFDEVKRDYRFALRLMAGMSRRLHGLVRDVEAYSLRSGLQRVIGYLLRDVASDEGGSDGSHRVSLAVSKATVASRLSLTPEYFSRVPTPVRPRKLGFVRKQHHIRRLFTQRDERLIGR
jgi:CRP-like cAMP-binding protein